MIAITGGTLIDPKTGTEGKKDLLIEDGVVRKICASGALADAAERIDKDARVVDATGCIVTAGLVDAHVHFRDPGQTWKEDILTGAAAAKKGGYTSVVMMGNTDPHPDNPDTVRYMIEKGKETGIRVYACGNVTVGMKGKELTDMRALKDAGAVLLTDDGLPIRDADVMRRACKEAAALNLMISLHEEDPAYVKQAGVNAGEVAKKLDLEGASREAEITMVERDIAIADETGCSLTIQHISAAESVDLVRAARKRNPRIHAEASPHHFTLTEEAVLRHGTLAKVNPPIRTERDRGAIIEGLVDGTIETIATDHAPHAKEEKARPFPQAPSGMIGLETALSLGIRELVQKGHLSMTRLLQCMSVNPARIAGITGGALEEGGVADVMIFDPNATWRVETFASKSENSPFVGETLPGVVRMTICGGKVVYEA